MTILHICHHLLNCSTFLQIILGHTCQFGQAKEQTFLKTNLRVLKTTTTTRKGFARLLRSLNFKFIFYTYCRTKNDRTKIPIDLLYQGLDVLGPHNHYMLLHSPVLTTFLPLSVISQHQAMNFECVAVPIKLGDIKK